MIRVTMACTRGHIGSRLEGLRIVVSNGQSFRSLSMWRIGLGAGRPLAILVRALGWDPSARARAGAMYSGERVAPVKF